MPDPIRVFWGQFNGTVTCTLNDNDINHQSVVFAAVSEGDAGNTTQSPQRFLGSAPMRVENIAPFDGGVVLRLQIDWGSPLNVWTDIFILDQFPQGFLRGH